MHSADMQPSTRTQCKPPSQGLSTLQEANSTQANRPREPFGSAFELGPFTPPPDGPTTPPPPLGPTTEPPGELPELPLEGDDGPSLLLPVPVLAGPVPVPAAGTSEPGSSGG